jgi:voltage-gated potassium channel
MQRPFANAAYKILHLPEESPVPGLLRRIGLAIIVIIVVAVMLWFGRGGLHDNAHPDREMTFVDVLYFTIITLTTVGYGDIIPVTPGARLVNSVLLTPIRVFVWAVFLGTAYELILQRYRERVSMTQLKERLKDHTIICGFGVKGRAILSELVAHGHVPGNIVVIDPEEAALHEATALGLAALRGDASSEAILHSAAVEKAGHILVAPHRDDQCVLICLTVRSMAPNIRLIVAAREEENVKLLYRAGADVVIAPSLAGGRLMGAAVRQKAVTRFLQDLMVFGQGMDTAERVIASEEAGLLVTDLKDLEGTLVLGVARGDEHCPFNKLKNYRLQPNDIVVYLIGDPDCVDD